MALTDDAKQTLVAVLDRVVPPSEDGRLPGAGEIGLADVFEAKLEADPVLAGLLRVGLEGVEEIATRKGGAGFTTLSEEEQVAALEELEQSQPAFMPTIVFHTYTGYYEHPRVLVGLGLEARPPYPKGYELEQGDLTLLDAVRGREGLYRKP